MCDFVFKIILQASLKLKVPLVYLVNTSHFHCEDERFESATGQIIKHKRLVFDVSNDWVDKCRQEAVKVPEEIRIDFINSIFSGNGLEPMRQKFQLTEEQMQGIIIIHKGRLSDVEDH